MSFDAYFAVYAHNTPMGALGELAQQLPTWFEGWNEVTNKPDHRISGGWSLYSGSFKQRFDILDIIKKWCKDTGAWALVKFSTDGGNEECHIVGTTPLIITRHKGLVELMVEDGLIPASSKVLSHVEDPESLNNRWVIGILPMHLAAKATVFSCPELDLPFELRGKELSKDEMRPYFKGLTHYYVGKF